MATPKCADCGISVMKAHLHRANPKGEVPAIWKCENCFGKPIPKETKELLNTIAPIKKKGWIDKTDEFIEWCNNNSDEPLVGPFGVMRKR